MSKLINKFKKKVIVLASVMLVLQPLLGLAVLPANTFASGGHLVINQIQTRTVANASYDFIELYNPTASPIDLNGYRLVKRTAAGTSDTNIKSWASSAIVPAGGYYLWANSGYASIVTTPDVTTSETIADDNGVALRDGAADTGTVIDSVGWGGATNAFVETAAAQNPSAGQSITRTNGIDTNNNSIDFSLDATPTPKNSDNVAPVAPDASKMILTQNIPGIEDTISGDDSAVEVNSIVRVYKDAAKSILIGGPVTASTTGSFATTSIGDNQADASNLVYVTSTDSSGNESDATAMSNDITAPEELTGLTIVGGDKLVTLNWTNPTDTDFAGVNVYRSTVSGTLGDKINATLVTGTNAKDITALNDTKYFYMLKTIDNVGNESLGVTISATPKAPVVLSPVVTAPTTTVVTAVAEVPVDEQFGGGASSDQGEVKADTTVKPDNGGSTENKDDQKTETKGKKNIPLWGIIFLLILAGIGGYLFYSQSPDKSNGKK